MMLRLLMGLWEVVVIACGLLALPAAALALFGADSVVAGKLTLQLAQATLFVGLGASFWLILAVQFDVLPDVRRAKLLFVPVLMVTLLSVGMVQSLLSFLLPLAVFGLVPKVRLRKAS